MAVKRKPLSASTVAIVTVFPFILTSLPSDAIFNWLLVTP